MALCLSSLCAAYAQEDFSLPQVFSPDAAELGKYGRIPVNYFNGLPEITVPLTEVKAKNYTLPVYLSYHASGNRPDSHPGWVGQGWSLHAGGCINRIINDIKDESVKEEFSNNLVDDPGYLYHAEEFQEMALSDSVLFDNPLKRYYDYEPDEFQINIDDIQASFFITGNGRIKIQSQSDADFKVAFRMNESARNIGGVRVLDYRFLGTDICCYNTFFEFIVTNVDGTRYYFGGNEDAVEYSMVQPSPAPGKAHDDDLEYTLFATANTWMLTKIERPDGEEITFTYKRGGTPIVETKCHNLEWAFVDNAPNPIGTHTFNSAYASLGFYFLLPSYLESINCKYGTDSLSFFTRVSTQLDYDYTEEEFYQKVGEVPNRGLAVLDSCNYYLQLDRIETNRGDILCDYTNDNNTRLKLRTVQIVAAQSDTLKYEMSYDATTLPGYNSRKTDPWGFYNRETPYSCFPLESFAQRRAVVDSTLLKAEMLTRIKYPTGGWTDFEYDSHDFSKVVSQYPFGFTSTAGRAGGLRIKKITDNAPGQPPVERTFLYVDTLGASSGILSGYPVFFAEGPQPYNSSSNSIDSFLSYLSGIASGESYVYAYFSENKLNQLSDTRGNHVTYSRVLETMPGNGLTEYVYFNHDSQEMACMDCAPVAQNSSFNGTTIKNPFTSMAISRGLLKKKSIQAESGLPIIEEYYSYAQDTADYIYSHPYFLHFWDYTLYRGSLIKVYTYFPGMTRKVTVKYSDNGDGSCVEVSDYEYNVHRQVVKNGRRTGVKHEEVRTAYTGDLTPSGVYAKMQEAGIFSWPVEQTVLRDGKVISSALTTYRRSDSLFVQDKYYESRLNTPCPDTLWRQYNGGFSDWQIDTYGAPKMSYDRYDAIGNIKAAIGEGGSCYRYFWDSSGMYPEAAFTGMLMPLHYEQVADSDFESVSFNDQMLTEYGFLFDAHYSGEFSFYMDFPDGRGYNLSGTMDGDTVFHYTCPSREVIMPISKIYDGVVSSGQHTFKIILSPDQGDSSIPETIPFIPFLTGNAMISYPKYRQDVVTDNIDVWFDGFEDDGNRTGGFNSEKSWSGQKLVSHAVPSDIPYTVDWMELRDGQWQYRSETFSGSRTIGVGVTAIDNVRVYPSDAAATNWTWTRSGELRSVTDGRGITESYEYDGMGRLIAVRDMDGKRRMSYEYQYQYASASIPNNYVKKKVYTDAAETGSRESISFFDGLGRPWQTLSVNAGKDGQSIAHLCERTDYDASGRPFRTWLPVRTTSISPKTGVISEPLYSDSAPYSLVEYDPCPLDRPRAEYGPGENWYLNEKAISHGYLTNGSDSLFQCESISIRWTGDTSAVITRSGPILEGTLEVKSVTDEDGLMLLTFTDMFGRVLLERRHPESGDNLDTYYVYDDMGKYAKAVEWYQKALAVRSENIKKYAYLYRYDSSGNCLAKKLPGCGWTFMVYDARGELVLSQDAEQRNAGKWTVTLSDSQRRLCITGTCSASPDVFGNSFGDHSVYARRTGDSGSYNGYTLYMIDPQNFEMYQTNRWSAYGLSGSHVRVLGPLSGNLFLQTTNTYDSKGRVIQTSFQTHLGGTETEHYTYNFIDEITSRALTHTDASGQTLTEQYDYTYDNWGRLLTTGHRFGTGPAVQLHDNVYDGLGRQVSDRRNGVLSLQTNIQRNVRSWITGISCGTGGSTFQESLYYESPAFGGTPLWGGRISLIDWRYNTDIATRRYVFGYDGYGRLASAGYCSFDAAENYGTSYSYDANSNITRLSRIYTASLSSSGEEKETTYSLDGNQIIGRTETTFSLAVPLRGHLPEPEPGIEPLLPEDELVLPLGIAYDRCGRMVRDTDKGILSVEYNQLGLPSIVRFATNDINSSSNTYGIQYSADGRKLRTGWLVPAVLEAEPELSLNATLQANVLPASMEGSDLEEIQEEMLFFPSPTDYVGNLVYRSGTLDKILIDGGFISATDSSYHFFVTDHQGNIRVVTDASGSVEQNYNYYPDGESITGESQMAFDNPYRWSGKEWDEVLGSYDFGARLFSAADSRWTTPDRLCEKFYPISPYAYCAGDPVNLVDPEGMDIIISGRLAQQAFEQIQERFKDKLILSIDKTGGLSYTMIEGVKLKGQAKKLAKIIDDHTVTVNLKTTDKMITSDGSLFVGGAFMGNIVTEGKVEANQEINPSVLGSADSFTGTPGKMIMHELTEAYYGALLSKKDGISAPKATNEDLLDSNSIYSMAHNLATPQTTVYVNYYDRRNKKLNDPNGAVRAEWFVKRGFKSKVIQVLRK